MTWTKGGYRYAPCVSCLIAVEVGILDKVRARAMRQAYQEASP